jgi:hypothetical protein
VAEPGGADVAQPNESAPDRRGLWRWVAQSARPYIGWVLVALGALALFLGWYGVSGQSLTAKQLPYLVSGGLAGIGLIVIAAVFLITDDFRRQVGRLGNLEHKIDDLYALLVIEPAPGDDLKTVAVPETASSDLVALPTGSSYHRPDCTLVAGKPSAVAVDAAAIMARKLRPCRVCDPAAPATSS